MTFQNRRSGRSVSSICAGVAASLDAERSEWRAGLAEILHPAGDLARDSLSSAHDKAADLKDALVALLKQADNTWPVRASPVAVRLCTVPCRTDVHKAALGVLLQQADDV